jgi:hypothetical protein
MNERRLSLFCAVLFLGSAACGGRVLPDGAPYQEQRGTDTAELVITAIPGRQLDEGTIQRILENVEIVPMPTAVSRTGYALALVDAEIDATHQAFLSPPMVQQTPWLPAPEEFAGLVPVVQIELWLAPVPPRTDLPMAQFRYLLPPVLHVVQIWQLPHLEGPYGVVDPFAEASSILDPGVCGDHIWTLEGHVDTGL